MRRVVTIQTLIEKIEKVKNVMRLTARTPQAYRLNSELVITRAD